MTPSLNTVKKSLKEMAREPMVFRGSDHDLGLSNNINGMWNNQLQSQAVYTTAATIN